MADSAEDRQGWDPVVPGLASPPRTDCRQRSSSTASGATRDVLAGIDPDTGYLGEQA